MKTANDEIPAVAIFSWYTPYRASRKIICCGMIGYFPGSWSNDRDTPPCTGKNVNVGSYSIPDYRLIEDRIGRDNDKVSFTHLVELNFEEMFGGQSLVFSENNTKGRNRTSKLRVPRAVLQS